MTSALSAFSVRLTEALNPFAPASYILSLFAGILIWMAGVSLWSSLKKNQAERKRFQELSEPKSQINPLDDIFVKKRIWLSDLMLPDQNIIDQKKFIGCEFIGPAVVYISGSTVSSCIFSQTDFVYTTGKRSYAGMCFQDCTITECKFTRTVFLVPPQQYDQFQTTSGDEINWITPHPSLNNCNQ